jgi:UDP-N-acetylglucosamine 2-epimerase (non-hydrolysing)
MTHKSIYLFIGTTAELIKLEPVIRELNKRKIIFSIIASGQNDIHFDDFPSVTKNIEILRPITPKSKKSSMVSFSVWSIRTFFSFLLGMRSRFKGLNKSNSLFLVHGDTVSSLMGSLVATVYGLKLVHIESGLRSFHFFEPFPEEICRYIVSHLSDIHFCPNEWSKNNLKDVKGEKVSTEENTLVETFWSAMRKKCNHSLVRSIQKKHTPYFVLVIHRQEHVMFGKSWTKKIVSFILNTIPKDLDCVFLVHDLSENFVTSLDTSIPKRILAKIIKMKRIPYIDFMHLVSGAEFMMTDGGSNQEELYYMGKPGLLLRRYTEQIEGINRNVVLSRNNYHTIANFINNYQAYSFPPIKIRKRPSEIIVNHLFPESK